MIDVQVHIYPDQLHSNDAGNLMFVHRRLRLAGIPAALNLGRGEIICPGLQVDVTHECTTYRWSA